MELFTKREKEIFDTLKSIKYSEFVIVGGYAVNAYTLPRFSTDCDLVVKDEKEAGKIGTELMKIGYSEDSETTGIPYTGSFKRYVKKISKGIRVSMDLLIEKVIDRQTGATFTAQWVFDNSDRRKLPGKTISEDMVLRIIDLDALFVMKAICGRNTDIRDVFMMVSDIKDREWVTKEIRQRHDLNGCLSKIEEKVSSAEFRDGLQGVFSKIPDKTFEKQKAMISELKE